jgi:hydroxymethylbilane synthase
MNLKQAATSTGRRAAPPAPHRSYLPLGVDLSGLPCLVVGGGRVGARKALTLAEAGARVTVIAPRVASRLREAVAAGRVEWMQRTYEPDLMDGHLLVVAATSDTALNVQIGRDAEERGRLSCVVSPGRLSRVIFPAIHRGSGFTVAVHTDGRDPAASRRLRDDIAALADGRPDARGAVVIGARKAALPDAALAALASAEPQLRRDGAVVLSTCMRWECWTDERMACNVQGAVECALGPTAYRKAGAGARHHLLRTACGLSSPLRGEAEIVSQLRRAAEASDAEPASEPGASFAWALRAQARLRRESGLAAWPRSWSAAVTDALRRRLGCLNGRRVLLFGLGRLAERLAVRLERMDAQVSAFSERAGQEGVNALMPGLLAEHLPSADAVVLSSPPGELGEALAARCAHGDLVVADLTGRGPVPSGGAAHWLTPSIIGGAPVSGEHAAALADAERRAVAAALRRVRRDPPSRVLRIGLRPSALAHAQAHEVLALLDLIAPALRMELVELSTPGDRDKRTPLLGVGDDDLFTRDLDEALLRGRVDLVVHSAKDVPSALRPGLIAAAVTPSVGPWECLVSRAGVPLGRLPAGACVGVSSARRLQRLLELRPDVRAEGVRGNVPDRIAQMDAGAYDALLLAAAGLVRLGLHERIAQVFAEDEFPPAPGQGQLAVMVRADDAELRALVSPLDLGDKEGLPWARES